MDNPKDAAFEAGFDLARRLAQAEVRQFLKDHGWISGQPIVMTVPGEPIGDVVAKSELYPQQSTLVAMADEREMHGFRLLRLEAVSCAEHAQPA